MARPRLIRRLAAAPVATIEAGGGYGKSVVAAELARDLGIAAATAVLARRDSTAQGLIGRLRLAFEDAGLTDLAAAIGPPTSGPDDALNGLLDGLRKERDSVLVVLDDVHHATDGDAGPLLVELAARLPVRHRLLVVGRRLPGRGRDLRTAPNVTALDAADLAFDADEVAALLTNYGVALTPRQAAHLTRSTGGWPAALILVAPRLARAADVDAALADLGPRASLPELVSDQLAALARADRAALLEVTHLASLDAEVIDEATGRPGLFDRIVAVGLPLTPSPRGGSAMPGPVQEHLASLGRLSESTGRAIAAGYLRRGRPGAALAAVVATGDATAVAEFLAGLSPEQAYQLDYVAIAGAVDALPGSVLEGAPRALIHFARACEGSFQTRRRSVALEQAGAAAAATGDAPLARVVDAERARDRIRDGRPDEAEHLASAVLASAGPGELETRARALDVLGRARAWNRDAASLAQAETLLEEAHSLYRSLGHRTWTVQIVLPLAIHVHFARARFDTAIERLDEALEGLSGRDRLRAVILTFRAQVLDEAGRFAEAAANLDEARALGDLHADGRILAYAAWEGAVAASQQGDADRTRALLAGADSLRGDWYDHDTGVDFLAAAAEALARVGDLAGARATLARALERVDEAPLAVRLAQASIEARDGDPERAAGLLDAVAAMPRLEPREAWRVSLFRALAAARAGAPDAAARTARAFDESASLGHPSLPLIRERSVTEWLTARAQPPPAVRTARTARTIGAAGVVLPVAAPPLAIRALGGFEVVDGGRPVPVPPGLPTALVKFLVVSGGRSASDEAVEALWPDAEPGAGRRGLRNVLLRLGSAGSRLVLRDGGALCLPREADVDALAFDRDAARALAAKRTPEGVVLARSALAQYRGVLLPDDADAEWAIAPRERLRLRHLRLLDLLIADATTRNDLDEALHLLERAIEADQYDEARYLEAARLLLAQGRRARARDTLARGAAMLAEIGVRPPPAYQTLTDAARRTS